MRALLPNAKLRFITLTVVAADDSLADRLDHLYQSFAKLRRSRVWKTYVAGGIFVTETTFNRTTHRWHPHLHLIVEGKYFPHSELRLAWLKASGDSFICDIKPVRDRDGVGRYITAYLTKSLAANVWHDPDTLRHAMISLHGRKLLGTFGSWAKLALLKHPSQDVEWITLCSADALLTLALRDEPNARRLASAIWRRQFQQFEQERAP